MRHGVEDSPGISNSVSTCDAAHQSEQGAQPAALTVSKSNLRATLKCTGQNNKFVPGGGKNVCAGKANATVQACSTNSPPGQQEVLTGLLGASTGVVWEQKSPVPEVGEEWSLELDESQLPLEDTTFFVGCQNGGKTSNCRLDITVQARSSSVESNVVKCAYGQHSNPQPLQVELTHDNNALTLECGSNHVLEPTNYSTNYCEDGTLTTCTKSFKEVLPNFTDSWWTEGSKPKESAKLTIPPREFPAADFKFYVGCKLAKENAGGQAVSRGQSEPQPQAEPSPCRVLVTVKAAGLATRASTSSMAASVAGAAAISGYLVGLF
ncbi:SAG-related sequence [Besnoitia besnoiti]|uniref:SAG-related sequence n=1 Tax=Besnoitia besnoiti TaxID=94643 RepID=A0A2A9MDW1_BESBE|nr:SAG-related sequence [Besnoitia besnoiti]PFH33863.1 SAG-related sequence [Besnoitia besnoiti]